ncbi:ATP-binding protein [bacterium]|nr:ATP-binding protein [bacterium]
MSEWIAAYSESTLLNEKPWVVLCWGAPAAGKSTVARAFCQRYQVPRLSSDAVNQALIGDGFQAQLRPAIYQGLLAMAEAILQSGGRLVLDGTFLYPEARQRVAELANQHQAVLVSAQVECSLGERLRRNAARSGPERVPEEWLSRAHSRAALSTQGCLRLNTQSLSVEESVKSLELTLLERLRRAHGLQRRRLIMVL